MRHKSATFFELPNPLYTKESNLIIVSGRLFSRPNTHKRFCCIELMSLAAQTLDSVSVCLTFFDSSGTPAASPVIQTYSSLSLKRDEKIGSRTWIPVPVQNVQSFTACILETKQPNGLSRQYLDTDTVPLSAVCSLEEHFGDPALAEQFRVRYGADCCYTYHESDGLWQCVCGSFNRADESLCHSCHRAKNAFRDLNLYSLRQEADTRIDTESEAEVPPSSRHLKKQQRKKRYLWLLPAVFLLALLIAAVPGALHREQRYREATRLLESGDLEAAEQAFLDLSSYRDSRELQEKQIPYLKACALLEGARTADASMLSEAGHSPDDVKPDLTVSMLLYQAASEAFASLDGYRDSDTLYKDCLSGIEAEKQRLSEEALQATQEEYDAALALLDGGCYSDARSRFIALSDFSNSADMAVECVYRKAVSIFQFLCRYDVSRIYASISTDPKQNTIFSLPSSEALRLGSGCVDDLRAACGEDPTDIRLEDSPGDNLKSLRDALIEMFQSLSDYSDAKDYPAKIEDETDYTRDFFMLCSTGDLPAAQTWLTQYEGAFPERDQWQSLLSLYLPYCGHWILYLGDETLLPYTLEQSFPCMSVSSRVILNRDSVVLRIGFGEGDTLTLDLPSEFGEAFFYRDDLESGIYMAALNNGHFVYMRYDSNWQLISSSDYIPG